MKRLIVDMDDVIADTTGQLINFYERDFGVRVSRDSLMHREEIQGFPGFHDTVRKYPFEPNFFRSLQPHLDSQRVMSELNRKYALFIVSAAVEFPLSMAEKLEWLKEHFPFLTWKQIVFCGSKVLVHGDYMIDDLPYNLEAFNGEKFIFSAPHNMHHNQFNRFDNWQQVGDRFL